MCYIHTVDYYITRKIDKYFRSARLKRETLKEVIGNIITGNTVSLGKKLFKTRMKAPRRGKRGSYRTIAYYKFGERIIFLVLFAKNERDTLSDIELRALKMYASELDKLNHQEIDALVKKGYLIALKFKEK